MTGSSPQPLLGPVQRIVLVVAAIVLAVGLTMMRGGLQSGSPLEPVSYTHLTLPTT